MWVHTLETCTLKIGEETRARVAAFRALLFVVGADVLELSDTADFFQVEVLAMGYDCSRDMYS